MKRNAGNAALGTAAVLAILVLVGSLGAWNYFRNLRTEAQVFRPFRGVSDAELSQLAEAYGAESERAESQYEAAQDRLGTVRDHAHLGDRVDEFERVRRRGEKSRALGSRAAELDSSRKAVEEELQIRERDRDRTAVFLRRLLTF